MDFNSPIFLFLLLPVFIILYHLAPQRIKLIIGIVGSLLFYAWGNLNYVSLMVGLTLFAYLLALGIDRWRGQRSSFILL